MNNISLVTRDACCGCKVCADACNHKAISYVLDDEGFFVPKVDSDLCKDCGLCTKVCPSLNVGKRAKMDTCYATYAKNKKHLQQGSSGGMFGLLARVVLSEGAIVYGAAFDANLKLKHTRATSEEELMPILKSKYLQSDCSGIYKQVKQDLKDGKTVLFSGTPCQCNAISNYIGEKSENLIIVDVVCHGTPSQELFDRCNKDYEEQNGCKVKSFQFRYKGKGVKHPQSFKMTIEKNGKETEIVGLHYQSPFYFGFQTYVTLRQSCYQCKQTTPERSCDITLADFWGINKFNPQLRPNDGVSMVAPHTDKGVALFEKVCKTYEIYCEEVPYDFAVENNGNLKVPTKKPARRDAFFKDLKEKDFEYVKQTYLKSKRQYIFDIYYAIPTPIRKLVRKLMDNRMRYE